MKGLSPLCSEDTPQSPTPEAAWPDVRRGKPAVRGGNAKGTLPGAEQTAKPSPSKSTKQISASAIAIIKALIYARYCVRTFCPLLSH